jgi:hypothetical protein
MLTRTMATKKKASKSRTVAKKKPAVGARKKPAIGAKKRRLTVGAKKKPAVRAKKASKKARPKPAAAKKRAAAKTKRAAKTAPPRRRDGAGHLDAKYAAELHEKSQEGRVQDPEGAFIGRAGHSKDNLAEAMGETWVQTATSGEDENEDVFNQSVPEDEGGPFVTTTAGQEFADGTDASNPTQSKREPFPKT